MSHADRYRPNSPPVIEETIDQETIMVNLETGSYYSLNPLGTYVWEALRSGAPLEDIATSVSEGFAVDAGDVTQFVEELVAQSLVVPRGEDDPSGPAPELPTAPYAAPGLSVYTDMQELLLLDPVHEVGAGGWPQPR